MHLEQSKGQSTLGGFKCLSHELAGHFWLAGTTLDNYHRSERDLRRCEVTKQLQIKPRKNSEAPTGFEPMISAIPVRYSTD